LGVIEEMGFPAYFLIVADLCAHARSEGIRVGPGRGSAGGSVVAYCTDITRVDPIRHGLIFERFLNPARLQMPDIDIDFDDRRRGEMIRYAAEKYGSDHVAQIITFSTIKGRQAIRDTARVFGYPYSLGDRVAKLMPPAIRPGPLGMDMHNAFADRKNGLEQVSFDHPDLEPILGETYGVIVYQEQVMKIATDLSGFSMSEADALRKAVGKKKRDLMEAQKDQLILGGVANG
ncbi:MAG: hypothetical protein ABR605_10990, partial [Desulfurivibrionaceae bacterium]